MNLYLVERTDEIGYDEFVSIVVAARGEKEALEMKKDWGCCPLPSLKVTQIGIAVGKFKAPQIIHESFAAG